MSNSQITKNALARSLKKLMLTRPLHKITIGQITDDCGLTRHTFYNHFHDIYELLGWVYQTEIIEDLEQYRNYAGWQQGFRSVLHYTEKNKTICLNTFHSLGREHLEKFLYDVIYGVASEVVEELARDHTTSSQAKEEIADFYTLAVLEQIIQWLKAGANTDPDVIVHKVSRIMGGCIERSLAQYQDL
ncbi:TetR/AcrR family transcriptional regulator C-terminal domain-containing protein [Paenibacillus agri]|uniref:TetR/AcrR family transcriptional regulator C-terminal domain-containing protein n=1 Tax=Paenibacillus agri TaxID=2744309 RepID=A0A850EV63_9BACL|nr:TetR/AcrR family transcriptional regulator C-terminal domain-containing protein [Paenibacillus agri]NUU63387.1 TetR/AcrR family transcriptional regulator C-terminal domain-containing protein [Paenibacillus agri]